MSMRPDVENVGVVHGQWGEDMACEYLRRIGYTVLERNARPCLWDHRLEIDAIVWDREADAIVFVEVKQHKRRKAYAPRLSRINMHKKDLLRRACRTWLSRNHWKGGYRFDVIEVYGVPGDEPVIDHIPRVRLFETRERFVCWG